MTAHMYRYQHQLLNLKPEKTLQIFTDLEKSLRTGVFSYKKPVLSKKQYEEMKSGWSDEAMAFFKQKAQTLAGENKLTPEIAYEAAVKTLFEYMLPRRLETAKSLAEEKMRRFTQVDILLSTVLDVAFDSSAAVPDSSRVVKVVDGKKIEARYTLTANMFRIDCQETENADIYVFLMFNEQTDQQLLIGWKSRSEVRSCKRGNKTVDPENCNWKNMSFYFSYPELNPMSDLMTKLGLKELPENALLEQLTQHHQLPVPDSYLSQTISQAMFENKVEKEVDYFGCLGIEAPKSPVPSGETKQQEKIDNDWDIS